ncbi:MAG: arginase [Acidobacteria bacterium]|nr:arginase [Acidobacteriota bacterium]
MSSRAPVSVIGVPLDLGAGRRGVDMGPSAMRNAGLVDRIRSLGREVSDEGNLAAPVVESLGGPGDENARYLAEIAAVLEALAEQVRRVRLTGRLPVVLGGDHSIALGTVSGMASATGGGTARERIGLLWIDAHTDANTPETSPSGNLHGMPLAAILGKGPDALTRVGGFAAGAARLSPANAAVIGARSVDPEEAAVVASLGVRVYTMEEVDRRGMSPVVDEALGRVLDGTGGFHLSLDVDALDPSAAPGVGTPVPGGLTVREVHAVMERAAASGGLRSLEVAEVNPILDVRNRTAELAVHFVSSALGKRVLGGFSQFGPRHANAP